MIKVIYQNISSNTADNTPEVEAAQRLRDKFQEDLNTYPNAKGTIYIFSSIRIFGQKRNDIDLLVIGSIDNFHLSNMHTKNRGDVEKLTIKSFIANIELKSHPASKVSREGTHYMVMYGNVKHDASQQANEAKFSLLNHLEEQLNLRTYICDVLWFDGLQRSDIWNMRGSSYDNALHRGFSFKDFVSVMLLQTDVWFNNGDYILNAFGGASNRINDIIQLFKVKREPKGLTRSKFELISQQNTSIDILVKHIGQKLTIVTGRAGTGKTIQLLQLAFRLASEEQNHRCVILTYNNALVSDIQRLIDYTPMPSKVDGRTVSIKTIDSFFQLLMRETGVLTKTLVPSLSNYRQQYDQSLDELYRYVIKACNVNDIIVLKDMAETPIDWDYILIDEAQDVTEKEKDILFKIYGPNRIIVADGVDQFMRSSNRQIWDDNLTKELVSKPKEMKLERRQKSNLVSFVNAYAKAVNIDWSLEANDNLVGGEIQIYKYYTSDIHTMLKENCNKNECENYDILILEPPSMVIHENGETHFKNADKYELANINIFDGTNSQSRTTYPTKDECRLYQYHSCRGLEGWCVVCDKLDELVDYQWRHMAFDDSDLGLDADTIKWRKVMLWTLMPLTRPIDTLVITLSNPDSRIGQVLKQLSVTYSDFISWNI